MTESVIAVHDISCFGRCSLTVISPIISGCGINCAVLPTALLSTHTGGFTAPHRIDLTDNILPIYLHWKREGLNFKGIYTGYLGSAQQPKILLNIFDRLKNEGGKVFVDPVMGDNGRLYKSISPELVKGMRSMVAQADIAMPNITEACLLLDIPYKAAPHDENFVETLLTGLTKLGAKDAVITGICPDSDTVGVCYTTNGEGKTGYYRKKTQGSYHGSGDMFGGVLVGKMMTGSDLGEAVKAAADFVAEVIAVTVSNGGAERDGLNFEPLLHLLQGGESNG